ncbi:MAG: hypothetical protein KJZ73_05000 [Pseudorhodoplanes sp.]|nr:hypothetical protein [Pseudorhodoplanes sp.]
MTPRMFVFAFILILPLPAAAGDGSFGVPPSGILAPPPARFTTAALGDHPRVERTSPDTTGSIVRMPEREREPAPGAGRSRPLSQPAPAPVKRATPRKLQAQKPVPTVDPAYLARAAAPTSAPAAAEPRRGLFAASSRPAAPATAAYEEFTMAPRAPAVDAAPQPQQAPQAAASGVRLSRSGTPCHELRGLFTSPPECR